MLGNSTVNRRPLQWLFMILLVIVLITACEPAAYVVVPTDRPTMAPSDTATTRPTSDPAATATFTFTPPATRLAALPTGGPSPTPLIRATRTPLPPNFPTATMAFNPNAPRIEFFTSDPIRVEPGERVTLYWSARNVDNAVIYRLDPSGARTDVYNVSPDGNLPINTRASERGRLRFSLSIDGGNVEEIISIPLECPIDWFFTPAPEDCANEQPIPSRIIDQPMQRGRLLYVEEFDTVYALFNDDRRPAWASFPNRFDPTIHPAREENAPPQMIQPINELGFVWRNDNDIRNRLGLGQAEAITFDGLIQTAPAGRLQDVLYFSGANGVVLRLPPGNAEWQIIGAPN